MTSKITTSDPIRVPSPTKPVALKYIGAHGVVVLFSGPCSGVVLHSEVQTQVGEWSEQWHSFDSGEWTPFHGKIELTFP